MVGRRGFLKISAAGAAGALLSVPVRGKAQDALQQEPVVLRRTLGKTGLEIPVVSMGVMRSDNPALVRKAMDMGLRHFDTAHRYQEGRNETMLGEVFKEYPRDSFIVGTKIPLDDIDRDSGEIGPQATKESVFEKVDLSLQRLQLEYVDILYLHGVAHRQVALHPEFLEALRTLKQQGRIRFAGVSTHRSEPEVIEAITEDPVYDVVLTAYNFKQGHREEVKEKIALAASRGIGIIAMKTMAGAFLDRERTRPVNCSAALKWVLQDPNVHTTIPGITAFDQLEENAGVMKNLEMTDEEKKFIAEAELLAGLYCDQCGQCVAECRKHLPVNEIMRAYMYAYGYRQREDALTVLDANRIVAEACRGCDACTVKCRKGFDVAERIADISRLSGVPRDFLV